MDGKLWYDEHSRSGPPYIGTRKFKTRDQRAYFMQKINMIYTLEATFRAKTRTERKFVQAYLPEYSFAAQILLRLPRSVYFNGAWHDVKDRMRLYRYFSEKRSASLKDFVPFGIRKISISAIETNHSFDEDISNNFLKIVELCFNYHKVKDGFCELIQIETRERQNDLIIILRGFVTRGFEFVIARYVDWA